MCNKTDVAVAVVFMLILVVAVLLLNTGVSTPWVY